MYDMSHVGLLTQMIEHGDAEEIAGRDLASRGRATVRPRLSALGFGR